MKKSIDHIESNPLWQVAEVKVSYSNKSKVVELPIIKSSKDSEAILRENWGNNMELLEEFNVLFLNRANRVKGIFRLSKGGTCGTVVDFKILFSVALKAITSSLILAHNHPSGSLQPSDNDIALTKKAKEAGKLIDINILDHLILVPNSGYYSFSDECLFF
ncbi:MAG: JAB domain-containing protein [Saprospiraceae bacterium]|nr:JAB domain-containing protein [Candidatus Vicinibacter proximus]